MNEITKQESFVATNTQLSTTETSSTALAAQSKAMIESRYIMAMRNPRDMDQVRLDLMKECNRPYFAQSAIYLKPIGKGIEGLSIRFVEAALRCMRNILIESSMIFEDDTKEIHRVSVTDLETNVTYPMDIKVTKTVERSKPADDGTFISVRINSYNKQVFTVKGTDDDLLNKRGALISKAVRTLGLRIIPGDLCDEAEEIVRKIRDSKTNADPDSERKKIIDAFAKIGVTATNLADYLGHPVAQCSPAKINELRGIYSAIKDGELTWKEVISEKELTDEKPKAKPEEKPLPDVYAALRQQIAACETVDDLDELLSVQNKAVQIKVKIDYQKKLAELQSIE